MVIFIKTIIREGGAREDNIILVDVSVLNRRDKYITRFTPNG